MSTKPDTQQTDINGYPACAGDLIKIYHFTDRRRRKYYTYKLVVLVGELLYAMNVSEIARQWKRAHKCPLSYVDKFEIVQGFGTALGTDFRSRPKIRHNELKEEMCTI